MASGLGFKTFVTGDVLTAGDTNGYLMQGVLVFASAAARDAAITVPEEGQFAYLKDTNVTTYYTGSTWTNLVGSGGLTLVKARTTFSSVATTTTTFDNVFTSTYKNYLVVIDDWTSTTSSNDPQLQMLYSGTTQATAYFGASLGTEYTVASVVSVGNNNATEMSFWRSIGNANGSYLSLYFSNVGSGSSEKAQFWGTGFEGDNAEMYTTGGVATVGRAYTGFLLKASTGNISGAATVYGLAIS